MQKRVLFITTVDSPVIRGDCDFLRQQGFVVQYLFYKGGNIRNIIIAQLYEFFWLWRYIWRSCLIFIWFVDLHALWPVLLGKVLFRKKIIIMVGGYDAAQEFSLRYGTHLKHHKTLVIRLCCRLADKVFGVSRFTRDQINRYIGKKAEELLLAIYLPEITDLSVRKVYNWDVAMVCGGYSLQTLFRKGGDFFVKISKYIPDRKFLLIGLEGEARRWVEERRPENLTVTGKVSHVEVCNLLSRSKVACQFSRYEAFGLAIGEAMAMGCIPVGLNYGGTPEVIGDAGFLIDKLEVQDALQAVEKALNAPDSLREKARRRIRTLFSPEVREAKLREVLRELGIRRG